MSVFGLPGKLNYLLITFQILFNIAVRSTGSVRVSATTLLPRESMHISTVEASNCSF